MSVYKIDGAKFSSEEELRNSLWVIYQDKMSKDEFEKYIKENMQVID